MELSLSHRTGKVVALSSAFLAVCLTQSGAQTNPPQIDPAQPAPTYKVDAAWPKPLPNHWIIGIVAGVAVDAHENIWIVHRPSTAEPDDKNSLWRSAPPVLEFSPDGTLLASWGGPGSGFDWPKEEHGIYVDRQENVWLGGAGEKDDQILKFNRQGKFIFQIGHTGQSRGSNDTENLGGPASMVVDEAANELYVADGYINHRVIVFDAATGAYKRHWGAYGKQPSDAGATQPGNKLPPYDPAAPPPAQFSTVHCLHISNDGLVYVCDRTNDRLQVFRKDGTFLQEAFIAKDTLGGGSVSDIGFSVDPQQQFAVVVDGTNQLVYVLDRKSLQVLSTFGGAGHWAGEFVVAHNLAVDSKGDLFITDVLGSRVQKFVPSPIQKPN